MPPIRLAVYTSLAMVAFAGNSLLCREALAGGSIDAASFTAVRLLSGAVTLAVLVVARRRSARLGGTWRSALALFVYAAGFSFAYLSLTAATGALLLFGAVQATMIGYGFWAGERFTARQTVGAGIALCGLVGLLLPGFQAPPLVGAALMLAAGVAWGVYSLRGRGSGDPTQETAGNFVRAVPFAVVLSLLFWGDAAAEPSGLALAVASGALASGVGYAVWYAVVPHLTAGTAATVQLTVPILAAVGGVLLLGEAVTVRLLLASVAILGGVGLFLVGKRGAGQARRIDTAVR
ncbi:MAG: DMT family transporter [Bacteroidota bacterium]